MLSLLLAVSYYSITTPGVSQYVAGSAASDYTVYVSNTSVENFINAYGTENFASLYTASSTADIESDGTVTPSSALITALNNAIGSSDTTLDNYYLYTVYGTSQYIYQTLTTTTIGSRNFIEAKAATTTWAAIPEPTSGLLLLVGTALLALKRRS